MHKITEYESFAAKVWCHSINVGHNFSAAGTR